MTMYAIVKTGGKQYRVEQGQSLLVERLPVNDGGTVALEPLLYVDGSNVVDDGEGLSRVKVEARVLSHERGPKLRVVQFKPKRGYKRRTGHRQELTRIEVTAVKLAGRRGQAGRSEGRPKATTPRAADSPKARKPAPARKPRSAATEAEGAEKPKATRSRNPKAKTEEGKGGA
jgi:large subunit ribosomal protein L21